MTKTATLVIGGGPAGLAKGPEVVTQDEYTHDVVVPYREPLYLAYDAT